MKKINTGTVLPPINQSGSERTSPANGVSSVNEKNLNKMLVLTKTDIDRLTNHLNRKQREDEERSAEMARKRELYERSKALTSNWNNTIEGSRRHKLEQKKIREEKLENMRKQIDLEHAEYMAEERKKAIEKAKLLQYHETDRIKTFHSALKLTEVLKEREAQLELKKILENLNREQEIEMEKHNQKLLLEKDKVDDSAYQKKVEETRKLYEYNKKQIELHMEKLKESQEQRQREAEMLQEESERIALENEQLEQIRRQKSKQLKETYDKILENKQKMREAEAIMDEEENEEIRVYAGAKKKMAQIKQKRELDALKKKEDHRERMLAYLGSLLKQQVEDEDFRIAKEVAKNEARTLEEERLKEQKFKEAMDSINKHRIDTINRREKEKEEQKKEEDEMMKMKMQADYLYQMYEIEKNKKRSEKQKHVSSANLKLAKERKEVESKTKKADREFVLKDLELLDLEDKQFQEYANKVIAYMEERDRNTYPMKKVLNEAIKPSQPIEIKGEAAQIKKHQSEVPTGKNLGFM